MSMKCQANEKVLLCNPTQPHKLTTNHTRQWFTKAGFQDVRIKRIGPKWYRGVRRHGLIMGCSVTGVKREAWPCPLGCATTVFFVFFLKHVTS